MSRFALIAATSEKVLQRAEFAKAPSSNGRKCDQNSHCRCFYLYRVPQSADAPDTEVYFAETDDTVGPFGAK